MVVVAAVLVVVVGAAVFVVTRNSTDVSANEIGQDDPIVTELTALETFYPAEPEHQDYFTNYPANGYCSVVIAPKIIKARNEYANWYKEVS